MGYIERKNIIGKIETLRNSKVITYIVTTRPKIQTMMQPIDLREIFRHLEQIPNDPPQKIDLFIYSFGGETTVSWALTNLVREFTSEYGVLVPYYAFSCATQVAVGANEIVMCKTGTLGPIDPKVANEFNPERNGVQIAISVEDIGGYISLLKDKFEMRNEEYLSKLSERLSTDIRPLALGNAYRQYIKARDDARKLLELHMDPINDKGKIDKIIETLVEKLYSHSHHINRNEAIKMGLNVKKAEEIHNENDNLAKLMWDLYLDYESEMQLLRPYKDQLPQGGAGTSEIPTKFVESSNFSSVFIIEQEWVNLNLPAGSKLANANNQISVFVPPSTILPLVFQGQPVEIGNTIYEKREDSFWKINR
jgi:hypothetical protein